MFVGADRLFVLVQLPLDVLEMAGCFHPVNLAKQQGWVTKQHGEDRAPRTTMVWGTGLQEASFVCFCVCVFHRISLHLLTESLWDSLLRLNPWVRFPTRAKLTPGCCISSEFQWSMQRWVGLSPYWVAERFLKLASDWVSILQYCPAWSVQQPQRATSAAWVMVPLCAISLN